MPVRGGFAMKFFDFLVLALVFAWLKAALRFMKQKKTCGCAGCSGSCKGCKRITKKEKAGERNE